jgi:hypothetical protein
MSMRSTWYLTTHRIHNRWLDLRGRLAGYCMATTWLDETRHGPSYGGGYAHWRCWRKRHPVSKPHRFNNYVWPVEGRVKFSPTKGRDGTPPPWGKHHLTATRRRARLMEQYAISERLLRGLRKKENAA